MTQLGKFKAEDLAIAPSVDKLAEGLQAAVGDVMAEARTVMRETLEEALLELDEIALRVERLRLKLTF